MADTNKIFALAVAAMVFGYNYRDKNVDKMTDSDAILAFLNEHAEFAELLRVCLGEDSVLPNTTKETSKPAEGSGQSFKSNEPVNSNESNFGDDAFDSEDFDALLDKISSQYDEAPDANEPTMAAPTATQISMTASQDEAPAEEDDPAVLQRLDGDDELEPMDSEPAPGAEPEYRRPVYNQPAQPQTSAPSANTGYRQPAYAQPEPRTQQAPSSMVKHEYRPPIYDQPEPSMQTQAPAVNQDYGRQQTYSQPSQTPTAPEYNRPQSYEPPVQTQQTPAAAPEYNRQPASAYKQPAPAKQEEPDPESKSAVEDHSATAEDINRAIIRNHVMDPDDPVMQARVQERNERQARQLEEWKSSMNHTQQTNQPMQKPAPAAKPSYTASAQAASISHPSKPDTEIYQPTNTLLDKMLSAILANDHMAAKFKKRGADVKLTNHMFLSSHSNGMVIAIIFKVIDRDSKAIGYFYRAYMIEAQRLKEAGKPYLVSVPPLNDVKSFDSKCTPEQMKQIMGEFASIANSALEAGGLFSRTASAYMNNILTREAYLKDPALKKVYEWFRRDF